MSSVSGRRPPKDQLVREIRRHMYTWWNAQPAQERVHIGAYCLWWSFFTVYVLKRHNIPAQIQAGSAHWPLLSQEESLANPDSISSFGYEFELNNDVLNHLAKGQLPEMHVWAAVAPTREIIDVTTQYWPEQAKKTANLDWPGPKPPPYLWATVDNWPARVYYIPTIQATDIAYQLIKLSLNGGIGALKIPKL